MGVGLEGSGRWVGKAVGSGSGVASVDGAWVELFSVVYLDGLNKNIMLLVGSINYFKVVAMQIAI